MTSGLNCSQMWRSKLFRSKQVYHLEHAVRGPDARKAFRAYLVFLAPLFIPFHARVRETSLLNGRGSSSRPFPPNGVSPRERRSDLMSNSEGQIDPLILNNFCSIRPNAVRSHTSSFGFVLSIAAV